MPNFQVFSPANGQLVSLEQVPDPVFSEKMLGDGIAVSPKEGFVVAPFDGKVVSIHQSLHAVAIEREGLQVLVHIGVESVNLQGKGFKALVEVGQEVKKGQKLIEFDLDFITQNCPSNLIIMIVTIPDGSAVVPAALGPAIAGQSVAFSVPGVEAEATDATPQATQEWLYSRSVTIENPNGLHARPAGKLASLAKEYSFPIEILKNDTQADAKSLVAVMGLSIERGAQIRLRAPQSAPQAQEVLEKLIQAIESGLGENISAEEATAEISATDTTHALTACEGLAAAPAFLFADDCFDFAETAENPAQENALIQSAFSAVQSQIQAEISQAPTQATREILQAHEQLLQDPFLLEQTAQQIQSGKSAPAAFNEAVRSSIDVLKKTKNRFLMERIADFKDLRKRVLQYLCGQKQQTAFPNPCILVAQDLLPSDVSSFTAAVKGVILAEGSPTAHVSILLRNMGLPSVVCAGEKALQITDGTEILLNATQADFVLNPSAQEKENFARMLAQAEQIILQNKEQAHLAAHTTDGVQIAVEGNVGHEHEAAAAQANGADGLGLVRTEFLFLHTKTPPSQEQQQAVYQNIANALPGKPITLRTLDIGGDKPVEYMPLPPEENPIVGLRGVRNYKNFRDLFISQIRAMLSVKPAEQVRIMLPMIAFVEEFSEYKQLIEQEKQALGITAPVQIGAMIEVPSAALLAESLAKYADFFSIGTNDLTQYTLAIDRGHKTLCAQADPLHPAVLHLIAQTCRGAAAYHRPVSVCGAVAADPQAVPLLIGLGVTKLAVGSASVAPIKALVRRLDQKQCAQAAQQALQCATAAQVRQLVKETFSVN